MRAEDEVADGQIAVFCGNLAHREEVAEGLGHLLVVDVDIAVVQPVVRKGHTIAAFGLRNLVFVVGEGEVLPAAVNVNRLAEVTQVHRRAFNVPAGATLAPRAVPGRLARLCALPEREIQRVFFLGGDVNARACFEVFNRHVRELAIFLKLRRAEVDIAVHGVGIALVHQRLDDVEDGVDVVGCQRVHIRRADAEAFRVGEILVDVALGNDIVGHALLARAADDLVVDVGEVLHEGHGIAAVFEVAAEHVEDDKAARVADMEVVVDGRAAGVHLDLAGLNRDKFLFFAGERVVKLHGCCPFRRRQTARCRPRPWFVRIRLLWRSLLPLRLPRSGGASSPACGVDAPRGRIPAPQGRECAHGRGRR